MTTAGREAPHHRNTVCILQYGCQIPACRARFNERRRQIKAGIRQPDRLLIDASPVRQHIAELQDAGMTLTCIARLAGVAHSTVCGLVHGRPHDRRGRQQATTPDVAAKILAVRPLTSTGALRRIQALATLGWTGRRIAERAGVSASWVFGLRPHAPMLVRNAEALAAAYENLRHLQAEDHGVTAGHAAQARQRAKDNRWPDAAYWDKHAADLEDPYFEPMYGVTRREIVAHDANELMRISGLDRQAAAHRLGISKAYIDHAFRDFPQYAVGVAA
ncbi:hypothetical protein [Streptomyces sp. NPDC057293]|uniref:hypothetical protein n=1 Tax=unclassified Streptomyces TaxID=2593676 RepID=UPI003637F7C1